MTDKQLSRADGQEPSRPMTTPPIVQYILVRTDLNWGQGAMIAQACHASVAAIIQTMDSKHTRDYLSNLKSMHKIILRADNAEDLTRVEAQLKEHQVAHHTWLEQPENIVSCLACSPQPKPVVQAIFKHLRLLK